MEHLCVTRARLSRDLDFPSPQFLLVHLARAFASRVTPTCMSFYEERRLGETMRHVDCALGVVAGVDNDGMTSHE